MLIDHLDRHREAAGSLARAAVVPGMYLAWCGNLHLLSADFQQANQPALTRLRYRDLSPAEFFTATTAGAVEAGYLSEEGRRFAEHYYPAYLGDLREVLGQDVYGAKDDWETYDRIAALLTRRFMAWKQGGADGRRRWWQVWR